MNRDQAVLLIASTDAHERLLAARFFSGAAEVEDAALVRQAMEREDVAWIRNALKSAVIRAEGIEREPVRHDDEFDATEEEFADQIYANAVEETTRRLIHEIEPLVGMMRLAVRSEVADHKHSQTWSLLNRLDSLLAAIGSLSRSARAPHNREFDLGDLIETICRDELIGHDVKIELSGRSPLVLVGDPDLVHLALSNVVRNAIEATEEIGKSGRESIVVTWGGTSEEMWIVVIDRGSGIVDGSRQIWEIGVSSKTDHLGMGLAIAHTAMRSLAGEVLLMPREGRGTSFEIRWPLNDRGPDETSPG